MSYSSKRNLISVAVGMILIGVYGFYALGDKAPAIDDLKAWAILILISIGIAIGVMVVVQIVFHVVMAISISIKERNCDEKEVERIIEATVKEDEREKMINLKSAHIGYSVAGFGFIAGLITMALGSPAVVALHILAGAFALGSIVEGLVSVYLDERGFTNG